jgi:ribulose-5-phosphate 4-epimerase/fuculose-1-phosphate aldolase
MSAYEGIRLARENLAAAYQIANKFEFNEGIDNHFTLAVPEQNDQFLLIPYGLHWSEVTASSLLVVNAKGEKLEGEGFVEPTAFHIHSSIHSARPDAACVMHCHPPYPLALCMIEDGRLEFADQNACRFFDRIAYDDDYSGGALDEEEGTRIAHALGDKDILFMANHGITVTGNSVAHAWEQLYFLNRACYAQILAMSTGRPLKKIPESMVQSVRQEIDSAGSGAAANYHRHFEALKRLIALEQPNYKN